MSYRVGIPPSMAAGIAARGNRALMWVGGRWWEFQGGRWEPYGTLPLPDHFAWLNARLLMSLGIPMDLLLG